MRDLVLELGSSIGRLLLLGYLEPGPYLRDIDNVLEPKVVTVLYCVIMTITSHTVSDCARWYTSVRRHSRADYVPKFDSTTWVIIG